MIKPIETQYKGYRFRSRLEARWAVVFDALDLAWVYEPEGYDLGGGIKYLPDFYWPRFGDGVYVEIKPTVEAFKATADKCYALSVGKDTAVLCLFDLPSVAPHRPYGMVAIDGHWFSFMFAYSDCLFAQIATASSVFFWGQDDSTFRVGGQFHSLTLPLLQHPRIISAFQVGAQARFEHGETPIVPNGRV